MLFRSELVRNGWHYPGEIARLDQERFLYVLGRESEVIIRAGAKIHPGEIEAVLLAHPGVAEAAVAGVRLPSDNEETIAAFVTAKSRLDLGDVLAHCRARLTSYKVPRQLRLVASMPRSIAGKVDKRALVGQFSADDPARSEES